jgi:hypothetical protein
MPAISAFDFCKSVASNHPESRRDTRSPSIGLCELLGYVNFLFLVHVPQE